MSMGKILGDRRYKVDCPIAKGGFSTVYRCVDLTTGKAYAVKVVNRTVVEANNMQDAVVREINAMEVTPSSKYVVGLVNKLVSSRNYYLIMDLVEGGSLIDLIHNSPRTLTTQWCRRMFRQLLNGLSMLHRSNVVHRDIKPENLLLNKERTQLVISDFGFACYAPPGCKHHRACGTLKYCAPELLQQDPEYDGRKVDVWAAGVTLYVMLFSTHPFRGNEESPDALVNAVMSGKYSFPRQVPPSLEHLFSVMLHPVPDKRWPVDKLLRHTWVLGVDHLCVNTHSHTAGSVSMQGIIPLQSNNKIDHDRFLVHSSFGKALEEDDLCYSSQRSRSCPNPSMRENIVEPLIHTIGPNDVSMNEEECVLCGTSTSKRRRKTVRSISRKDTEDGGKVTDEDDEAGGGISTDMDYISNDSDSSIRSFSNSATSFDLNSSTASYTSLWSLSKGSREEPHISYKSDFILTLKVIVKFFLFCTAFVIIGGMRLLLDVNFDDLPIPSFLRDMVERLMRPPDGRNLEHGIFHDKRNQMPGAGLREMVASAERAIHASKPRRRVVPT